MWEAKHGLSIPDLNVLFFVLFVYSFFLSFFFGYGDNKVKLSTESTRRDMEIYPNIMRNGCTLYP